MKRIIALLSVFASMWFTGWSPAWASGSHECSNGTLQGAYGFTRQGFNPARGHVGAIGEITFDGAGNFTVLQTNVQEFTGVIRGTGTGTYQVNSDCTGSTVVGTNDTLDLVIVSGGNEVFAIATIEDPPGAQRVVNYVLKKLFPQKGD
jgi:hypothetical protein